MRALAALLAAAALIWPAPTEALEVRLKELAAADAVVTASFDVRDVLPDKFRGLVNDGGVLHLRVQVELWERRAVWDRLVYPATVRVLRLLRPPAAKNVIARHADGTESALAEDGRVLPLMFQIGGADRLAAAARYYVRIAATLGTIAEREIDDVGDAVFGSRTDTNAIGSLGRLVLSSVLQLSDYLQSVSAETTSGRLTGRELLRR